ncbi:MAG: proton-conducting transporter membrane subunit, partial [Streptomyces albidoflavus]
SALPSAAATSPTTPMTGDRLDTMLTASSPRIGSRGAAASTTAPGDEDARTLAVSGAVTQMVSHGLLTGALFLLAGALHERGRTYDLAAYSGVAARAPVLAAATAVAFFASLGLPGFSGFVAEFQIFTGSLGARPVATCLSVLGILLTAALLLRAYQQVFLGPLRLPPAPGSPRAFPDLRRREAAAVLPLLALATLLGLAPRPLLDTVEPASGLVLEWLAR